MRASLRSWHFLPVVLAAIDWTLLPLQAPQQLAQPVADACTIDIGAPEKEKEMNDYTIIFPGGVVVCKVSSQEPGESLSHINHPSQGKKKDKRAPMLAWNDLAMPLEPVPAARSVRS